MNPMFVAICTIAVFLAGSSSALPSPLLGLGQIENGLPVGHGGSALSGLTEALPIVGGSKGGLLEIRSPAIHSENSSLEPRGMVPELGSLLPLNDMPLLGGGDKGSGLTDAVPVLGGSGYGLLKRSAVDSQASSLEPRGLMPGLDNLSGMTGMIPGMGKSGGGFPGMNEFTSMMPGMGGSNGGFLKVRRSAEAPLSNVKRDSQASSLEPRGLMPGLDNLSGMTGMIPGLDNLSGMTGMIPGMGKSGGGLPGMNEFTSMMPGMGGSNGGLLKVRRSTDVAPSHVKRLVSLDLDTPADAKKTPVSKDASSSRESSEGLIDLDVLPSTLSGLSL